MCVRSYFYRHKQLGQDDKHKLTTKWKSPISDASHSQRSAKTLVFLTRKKNSRAAIRRNVNAATAAFPLSLFYFLENDFNGEQRTFPFGGGVKAAIG
jgi:hypothetical protein